MEALDQLNARVDELTASNDNLAAQVEQGNAKADALIEAVVGGVLPRLQELIDAANQGGNVTAADIQAVADKVSAVLTKQTSTVASLDAQDVETDAATAAATAAVTPAPAPAPASPADDAFVAVGATRFSDGQVQTEESLAAAVAAWNAAHPEGPVAG